MSSKYYRTIPYIDLDLGSADSNDDPDFQCEYGYTSDEGENDIQHLPPKNHIRFWSDRFYLNATKEDDSKMKAPLHSSCHCGSASAPPLFPRERFIQSLDLQAAILGTFTWSPTYLAETFPDFVDKIPTLILHGQKGMTESTFWNDLVDRIEHKNKEKEEEQTDYEDSEDEEGNVALKAASSDDSEEIDSASEDFVRLADTTLDMAKKFAQSSTFQMNYVRCNWKKRPLPGDSSRYVSRQENVANGANANATAKQQAQRESRKGVHHPKFMLLLEKSGSLVVMVSTANLTPTRTVEGTWVQRFRPVRNPNRHQIPHDSNDFGSVLQDFVTKISDAAEHTSVVNDFMTEHFPCALSELAKAFHFEAAQVHLVPIIPGDYPSHVRKSKKGDSNGRRQSIPRCYYGHQRVRYILQELAKHAPQVAKHAKDNVKSDRLVLQPTSIGGDWTQESFAALVRGYMGYKSDKEDYDNDWICGQADIVWPSDNMLKKLGGASPLDHFREHGNDLSGLRKGEAIYGGGNFVFNSSTTFFKNEVEVVSRFCMFHASKPTQTVPKTPHFKSVARVCSNRAALRKVCNVTDEAETYFSWFLLTSACLSHGAQGVPVTSRRDSDVPVFGYRNFELGVLFTSRAPTKTKRKDNPTTVPSRMYCFHPKECKCRRQTKMDKDHVTLVHLPVPYKARAGSYFEAHEEEDCEHGVMKENPYFHEIAPHSRSVGNMLMTPFGRELIAMDDEKLKQHNIKRRRTV